MTQAALSSASTLQIFFPLLTRNVSRSKVHQKLRRNKVFQNENLNILLLYLRPPKIEDKMCTLKLMQGKTEKLLKRTFDSCKPNS